MSLQLTSEQNEILKHDPAMHGRVMSAPGSGKTTMAVEYALKLMREGFNQSDILILTFNRNARLQVKARLRQAGISRSSMPPVHNFHSFSWWLYVDRTTERPKLISEAQRWYFVNKAIDELERLEAIEPGSVDPESAMTAINLWKSSMIPPRNAGHDWNPNIPPVYREYERQRERAGLLDFDDLVLEAIRWLQEDSPDPQPKVIIVDEFQDTALAYLKLVQAIAGDQASVLVFGDDDQNLYEWNGTRTQYVLDFSQYFTSKPHAEYTMTRSFRFGPVIAQAAHNVIRHNNIRVKKAVIAHDASKPGFIEIVTGPFAHQDLAQKMVDLVDAGTHPSEIRVLARTYTQLIELEMWFLTHKIPYQVRGKAPFYERKSSTTLVDYLKLAQCLDKPVDKENTALMLSILNMPSRRIRRDLVKSVFLGANGDTVRGRLTWLAEASNSPLYPTQKERMKDLLRVLDISSGKMESDAADVLRWLVETTDYLRHFANYYGHGFESFDRQRAVAQFVTYVDTLEISAAEFIEHITTLDTTQGTPDGDHIIMTTGYQEKGCEYDYVVIPRCIEGLMPVLREDLSPAFDITGAVDEPDPSPPMESERRLFYVALTRARKGVYIGTCNALMGELPSRFIDELELEETTDIMGCLQQYTAGELDKNGVRKAFRRCGNISHIATNVLSHYLVDLGDKELASILLELLRKMDERGFKYRFAYEPPEGVIRSLVHAAWKKIIRW